MAEGLKLRENPLKELETEITCVICRGIYQQPKLLPCNHYYCSPCIEKMAAEAGPQVMLFHCPECRRETRLPPGGIAELLPAFFMERLKDVYDRLAKTEDKVGVVCEQCAVAQSVGFCRQCAEFICEECASSHEKRGVFAGHTISSLKDLKIRSVKSVPVKEPLLRKCAEHNEPLKLFCFCCKQLICGLCCVTRHRGHEFESLKKCAEESRTALTESLAPLLKVAADVAGAEKSLVSEEAKVDRQEKEVCRSIQQSFDQLKHLLDQRKTVLMNKTRLLARKKRDALGAQKQVLQVVQEEIQLVLDLVEKNIKSTDDQELMGTCTQLQTKVEEEEKRHRQLSLEPKATADIACNLPSLDVISKCVGAVYDQSSSPELFNININPIELGSQVQVYLSAPATSPGDIIC